MRNEIVLLGTKGGPAIRQGGAMPTASLLRLGGKNLLIDCGIGAARSVVEAGTNLMEIDAIFITHLHSDHLMELGPLIYTAWTTGMNRKFPVYGPAGTEDYWQQFLKAMAFDHEIRLEDEGRPPIVNMVEIHTISDGWEVDFDGIRTRALRVDHPPITDSFAFRFDHDGKSAVFSGDTCYFAPLADFAAGANVLVHEAMLVAGVDKLVARTASAGRLREHLMASHTPAADVGRIASAAMVGKLVLNHLVPADDPDFGEADWRKEVSGTWNGSMVVGRDGMVIPLPDSTG
ncbi:MAG: MBL fold metallo-hydrolase [Pseudorhodobacter sp.]